MINTMVKLKPRKIDKMTYSDLIASFFLHVDVKLFFHINVNFQAFLLEIP